MTQTSRKVQAEVYLERMTLVDKQSMFRASYPTEYHLRIMIRRPGICNVVAREFVFDKKADQTAHYKHLQQCFGLAGEARNQTPSSQTHSEVIRCAPFS